MQKCFKCSVEIQPRMGDGENCISEPPGALLFDRDQRSH